MISELVHLCDLDSVYTSCCLLLGKVEVNYISIHFSSFKKRIQIPCQKFRKSFHKKINGTFQFDFEFKITPFELNDLKWNWPEF